LAVARLRTNQSEVTSFWRGVHLAGRELGRERLRVDLTVRLLTDTRNMLVHEGVPFAPDIESHAEELERIAARVLTKLAYQAVAEPPMCRSLDDVLAWYRAPWRGRVR
jgi:hypothetical protein